MRRTALALIALSTLGGALAPGPAAACSCVPPDQVDLRDVLSRVAVLFWGRAVSETRDGRSRVYLFEVAAPKGVLPVRVRVRTPWQSATCGARFEIGETVLIGAGRRDGALTVGSCTQFILRTRRREIERLLRRCRPFGACP